MSAFTKVKTEEEKETPKVSILEKYMKKRKEEEIKMTKKQYEKALETLKKEISELTTKNLETLKENLKSTTGMPHPQIHTINEQITTNINQTFDKYIGIQKQTLVLKPFLPQTLWQKISTMTEYKQNFKEPLLILIRANNTIEIIEGIKPGAYITKAKEQTAENNQQENKKEYIELAPSKLLKIYYGGKYFSCWIANELDGIPYPHEIKHDSHLLYLLVKRFALSWKEFKEGDKSKIDYKMWFWIIAGTLIFLYLAFQYGWIDKILGNEQAQNTAQQIANNITR